MMEIAYGLDRECIVVKLRVQVVEEPIWYVKQDIPPERRPALATYVTTC